MPLQRSCSNVSGKAGMLKRERTLLLLYASLIFVLLSSNIRSPSPRSLFLFCVFLLLHHIVASKDSRVSLNTAAL